MEVRIFSAALKKLRSGGCRVNGAAASIVGASFRRDKIGGVSDLSSRRDFSPEGQALTSERELQAPETVPPDHDATPAEAARAVVEHDPGIAAFIRERKEDTGDDEMVHYLNADGTITIEPDRWTEPQTPTALPSKPQPSSRPAKPSPADTDPNALLEAPEVAAMLRVSTQTVLRLSREGKIPTVPLGEKTLRYRPAAIREWLGEIEMLAK